MVGEAMLRVLPVPGNPASDALGTREEDDRAMIRVLTGMLVRNLVLVLAVGAPWSLPR